MITIFILARVHDIMPLVNTFYSGSIFPSSNFWEILTLLSKFCICFGLYFKQHIHVILSYFSVPCDPPPSTEENTGHYLFYCLEVFNLFYQESRLNNLG
jgi:hypothetical protein